MTTSTRTSNTAAGSSSPEPHTASPELRISEEHWRALRRDLDRSFRSEEHEERGALALLGEIRTTRRHVFTVVKVVMPRAGEVDATGGSLVFSSSYIRRVHLEMRQRRLAGIATFHTHPTSRAAVAFSFFDDTQDPDLFENLTDLDESTRLVSVVLGRNSQAGRLWSPAGVRELANLTVVGEGLQRLPIDGCALPPPPGVAAAFDRGAAVTGGGAMALLRILRVVVVGASGIGSLVGEALVRAGCGVVGLVEHDVIGEENLNRMLHSTMRLAREGAKKLPSLAAALRQAGLPVEIVEIPGNVLDEEVLAQLRDADVFVGCVDRDWPRELLSKFSFQYLVPYIDLGTEIGTDESGQSLESLDARVSYVAPGRWCLPCAGFVDPRRVAYESATTEERGRIVAMGYSDDLALKQPAVMELNMRAASMGVIVLRHLLQPILPSPLPVAIKENLAMLSMRAISEPRHPNPECATCRVNDDYGTGDKGTRLGYPADVLAARS